MTAAQALRSAIVSRLRSVSGLFGVFNDAPARAAFPYVVVTCRDEKNWGGSGAPGREIIASVSLWDDEASRLPALGEQVDVALRSIANTEGWMLSSLLPQGTTTNSDPLGPETCTIALRARMLEVNEVLAP